MGIRNAITWAGGVATGHKDTFNATAFTKPGEAGIQSLFAAGQEINKIYEGKGNPDKLYRESLKAIGYLTGIPQQGIKLMYNLNDYFQGGKELGKEDVYKMRPASKNGNR